MYMFHSPEGPAYPALHGILHDSPDEPTKKSVAAIRAALDLSPASGYVKGSAARRQLEEALESVPLPSALDLAHELVSGQTPLGKLFRYRLAPFTQGTMVQILVRKATVFQEQQKEALRRQQDAIRRQEEARRKRLEELTRQLCGTFKEQERLVDELCRRVGPDADLCRTQRQELSEARRALRMQDGIQCPP